MNKKTMNKEFGVATKAIIYSKGNFLVLLKSDRDEINPKTYDFPGGRINFGEKLEEALKREVFEEVGLRVNPLGIVSVWTFVKNENFQLVGINYACTTTDDCEVKLSPEHEEFEWVRPDDPENEKKYPPWLSDSLKKAQIIIDENAKKPID